MIAILRRLGLWAVAAAIVFWLWPDRGLRHPPGVLVAIPPVQTAIPPRVLGAVKDYQLEARAAYILQARVLHTKRYWADQDDLVPYDVALGWGPMSDQSVLDRLEITQGNRFFFYSWTDQPPIPPALMMRSAANVHVISANAGVAKAVRKLRAGQIVTMKGYLVNVSKPDGFHWKSSLTRDDDGNGACELFYVEAIRVGLPVPAATPAPSGVVALRR